MNSWKLKERVEGKDVLKYMCPECRHILLREVVIKGDKRADVCGQCHRQFPPSKFLILTFMRCQCGHQQGSDHDRGVARCRHCDCKGFMPEWIEAYEQA